MHRLAQVSCVTILRQELHKYMGTGEDSLGSPWTVTSSCLFSNGKRMMQCALQCVWSSLCIAKTLESRLRADEKQMRSGTSFFFSFATCNTAQGWCSGGVNDVPIRDRSRWLISHPTADYLISWLIRFKHVFSLPLFFGSFTVLTVALFLSVFARKDAYYVNAPLRNLPD